MIAHAQTPRRGGTLNILINPEPPVLVSLFQTTGPTLAASSKVIEGLLAYDFDMKPVPQLATAWSVSPDTLQYTFTLRDNVKFHDGQPFSSADVAFSIDLLKTIHPRGRSTFANVTRVSTPDARTAIIELSRPAPYLIKALSAGESPMVPKHLYASGDPLSNPHNNAPVGTGPFRFKSWTRGANIVYERNPEYWDAGKPYIDTLIYKVIPDAAARSAAFETGALDLGGENPVPLTDLARLTQLPHLSVETRGYRFLEPLAEIDFNLDHPVLKDVRVRRAIAHAINPEIVQKTVQYGYADVSPSSDQRKFAVSQRHDQTLRLRHRRSREIARCGWIPAQRRRSAFQPDARLSALWRRVQAAGRLCALGAGARGYRRNGSLAGFARRSSSASMRIASSTSRASA